MKQAKTKLQSLDYLLGGVGILAMLTVIVPSVLVVPTSQAQIMLGLMFVAGCYGLWWALHHFAIVTEKVVAVVCVLVGVYLLFGLSVMLSSLSSL